MAKFDFFFVIVLIYTLWKGYKRGLVFAFISFIAWILGAVAAIKLSGFLAILISKEYPSLAFWTPVISFTIIFAAIILISSLLSKFIERMIKWVWLSWANNLLGAMLYGFLTCFVFSIILFYLDQMDFIAATLKSNSVFYPFLVQLGPKVFDMIGILFPYARTVFEDLMHLFDDLNKNLVSYVGTYR